MCGGIEAYPLICEILNCPNDLLEEESQDMSGRDEGDVMELKQYERFSPLTVESSGLGGDYSRVCPHIYLPNQ